MPCFVADLGLLSSRAMTSERPYVIVVDGDPIARQVLTDAMAEADCQADACGTPDEAKRKLESGARQPCLIVVDLFGIESAEHWRFREWLRQRPQHAYMIISNLSEQATLEKGLCADEFILKAGPIERLLDRVRQYCVP